MDISKDQLIIPVYVNEKIVLDMLAIVEDGFSMVSEVCTYSENSDKKDIKVESEVSTQNILSTLLKIKFNTDIEKGTKKNIGEGSKSEKVHTDVSLLSKFRTILEDNNLLSYKSGDKYDISMLTSGDFIEVEGELQKNPMIDLLEKYLEVCKLAGIFEEPLLVDEKRIVNVKNKEEQIATIQMSQFLDELKSTGTIDFILENSDITLVLSAQEKYMSNDNISELVGGQFKVLGKVIKTCDNERESIDLLRKTTLGMLDKKSRQDFLRALNSNDLEKYNLPKVRAEIDGPAYIIIPIAIYA